MSGQVLVVTVALIEREGRYFLQRRAASSKRFANLWEFPGGKLEPGETPREALLRELMEELAWTPEELEPLPYLEHVYPDLRVAVLSGQLDSRHAALRAGADAFITIGDAPDCVTEHLRAAAFDSR